ncbi:MAG: type II toxin-antitoxin system Phd/YefM family antitoxin [Elusimicrobia bacterium]|nr:type II toxin-antitoxin system Phd/YefM family antitoxin [Elusimicrobiota bacterium]
MTFALPATEFRGNLAAIISKIRREGATCMITQKGRATAVVLPLEVYNRLISDLEDWMDENDPELTQEIEQGLRDYRAKKTQTLKQILK